MLKTAFLFKIVLFLSWAAVLLALESVELSALSHEMKLDFRRFVEQNHPLLIHKRKIYNGLSDSIHWPEKDLRVFLELRKGKSTEMEGFKELWTWSGMYTDNHTLRVLKLIDDLLAWIKPKDEGPGWFRAPLTGYLHPHRRQGKPLPHIIRNIVDRLLLRVEEAGHRHHDSLQEIRNHIKKAVDDKYGSGSFEGTTSEPSSPASVLPATPHDVLLRDSKNLDQLRSEKKPFEWKDLRNQFLSQSQMGYQKDSTIGFQAGPSSSSQLLDLDKHAL